LNVGKQQVGVYRSHSTTSTESIFAIYYDESVVVLFGTILALYFSPFFSSRKRYELWSKGVVSNFKIKINNNFQNVQLAGII
jgi:phosphoribosyl-AMP cyclohydrolase